MKINSKNIPHLTVSAIFILIAAYLLLRTPINQPTAFIAGYVALPIILIVLSIYLIKKAGIADKQKEKEEQG
jgi:predicted tellurium resistance membrane protein TerC